MQHLQPITRDELATIGGGAFLDDVRTGLRGLYKGIVAYPTAAFGGPKLARQVLGGDADWHDYWDGMVSVKGFVDRSNKIPDWARFWA